ncbi:MAG: tyrosine-type recombinase/integrase [Planctomycetaceae bacterium]|nr:tyrosine-type recombinase/integrase [Planctomycetaceae bacterium]
MARKLKVPRYCLHKASGRAVVRIGGRDHYLGAYGSDESHAEYARIIAEWQVQQRAASERAERAGTDVGTALTVAEVMAKYRDFAQGYYTKNGGPGKEFVEMRLALRPVRKLYGDTLTREFGPLKLQAVRQQMIEDGLSRGVINNRVNRIRRFFKWAVAEELIPLSVLEGLRAVAGLKRGRTAARETAPVQPVSNEFVDAILPYVAPPVAAMIQLQRLTGMRPCEVVMMRACDLDMTRDIWIYSPAEHKNSWRGHDRLIPIGPNGQELIRPFITLNTEAYLFSPKATAEHLSVTRRAARKTPMTPSQRQRKAKSHPRRAKRDHYDTDSYRRAITYGIQKVNKLRVKEDLTPIPKWFPLQLRHSRATELNELYGIEAAAVSLGHAHADVTKVYAERNLKLAIDVARKTG